MLEYKDLIFIAFAAGGVVMSLGLFRQHLNTGLNKIGDIMIKITEINSALSEVCRWIEKSERATEADRNTINQLQKEFQKTELQISLLKQQIENARNEESKKSVV